MSITLTDGTTTLALDADLLWDDEFTWAPVEQAVEYSLTGALVVDTAARQSGRPITLRNEDDRSGWITRGDMAQLQSWAAAPGQQLTLTLRGTAYTVIFRHHGAGPFEARALVHYADPVAADWVLATLRFTVI